jgi:ribosomal protein S18 acetylase RimI-like enzyme
MLKFNPITHVDDKYFNEMYTVYSHAFPAAERRSWAGLDRQLNYEKRFMANALVLNEEFVGFFNYWTFDRFLYIEHFALTARFRSQRIGTRAIEMFKEHTSLPIVLEVEMPSNSETIRRIRFYEDLGFRVLSHYYAQPPYEGGGFLMPMLMLSNDLHFANTHFELIKDTLYKNVYHFTAPSEEVDVKV